ncbi:MAG: R3H domain-containing nucleic acid-binding protein [Cyanobacteriota bacterium]|nr:R3H domain-containing nucleic acid-binding protein [Cyanobacteriota bacterium]
MQESIQRGQRWLERLLRLMDAPASVRVLTTETAEGETPWLEIDDSTFSAEQIETLIGDRGKTIDALQYLANTLLNIAVESPLQQAFTVELNGYRLQRQNELRALVDEVAGRVRETGNPEELQSLSSAERRQVHSLFKEHSDLTTESQGAEPHRRLVVRLS